MDLVKAAAQHGHLIAEGVARAALAKLAALPFRAANAAGESFTRALRPSSANQAFHEWSTAKAFKELAAAQKEHAATLAAGNRLGGDQAERIRRAIGEARIIVRRHGAQDPRVAAVSERYGFGPAHRDALGGTFHEDLAPEFRRLLAPT